jgi:predicted nucleic acid-binding protein
VIRVLDTNAFSALMRGESGAVQRLTSLPRDRVLVPQPVVAELAYGLERLPSSKRKTALEARFELLARELRRATWDDAVSRSFGRVKAQLERKGTPIEDLALRSQPTPSPSTASWSPPTFGTGAASRGCARKEATYSPARAPRRTGAVGTGSGVPRGTDVWQRRSRAIVSRAPCMTPHRPTASMANWEQEGTNRHLAPMAGERST